MILQYVPSLKEWLYEAEADQMVSFGFNHIQLPPVQHLEEDSHSFTFKYRNGNAGPLIGIMAGMDKRMNLIGNGLLFQDLQAEVVKRNGMIVVFPPETLGKDGITGVTFLPDLDKWIPIKTPLPHIVYNRIPFRKSERHPAFTEAIDYLTALDIPVFNPAFLDKYQTFRLFSADTELCELMPDTILLSSVDKLYNFILKHQRIYLKPASSSRGNGIFRLRFENGQLEFTSHVSKLMYPNLEAFWEEHSRTLMARPYIAQKEVFPSKIKGNRFDFRVHAHDGSNGYEVTGIGVRQAQKQDLTTHLPNGGMLLPYDHFRSVRHDRFFAQIVPRIGKVLSSHLGYFGEFSLDAGVTEDGSYVIYEVNSKPMVFDEVHIEKKRVSAIADLFFRKSGF